MSEFIRLYTDGSSRGNPGPGGYGIVLKYKDKYKELSKGYRLTTNNRMELLAVIEGIKQLKTSALPVRIFSDSKYVIDTIQKGWLHGWLKTNFKGKKNKDLWLEYIQASKGLNIEFVWVKGHNGHPENEKCDELAVKAALGSNLLIDAGYEAEQSSSLL
jgi:ribonuclease HI